jgi:spore coat protein A
MHTLLAALLLFLPLSAAADTVIIEPVKDNTLYDEPTGALSNGAGVSFFAGLTGEVWAGGAGRVARGLLEFDVAGSVPAGSTITSATLTLYLIQASVTNPFTPNTVGIHVVSTEWGEGTSQGGSGGGGGGEGMGAPSTTNDATWIHTFYSASSWGSAGGDFNPTDSASMLVGPLADTFHSWSTAQLATDVQGFLDNPSNNHGWMVKGTETANSRRFASRTHPTPANHPMLTIEFTPPAGGTGACCAPDGTCGVVADPGSTCVSPDVYQGLGTVCSPNTCPQPTGACCIPDASATCNEVTAAACATAGGTYQGNASTCGAADCPVIPTAYLDPMPIPAVATPVSGLAGGVASYDIAMRVVAQTLHSELPPTTLWAYGDGPTGAIFPGPTIEATSDQSVTVNWINDLRDSSAPGDPKPLRTDHLLPVDTCPHGSEDTPKTVVHLHGAHTQEEFDGHPEDTFLPGSQDTYIYENHQLPSALWYHDHALGQTRLNVYLGLAGMYLIRDATENALGLPAGEFELPLVIMDRSFDTDGSLEYPATLSQVFFGETMLVNGQVWPYFDVKQGKYRFRVLNASNSRTLTLELCAVDESPCTSPLSFDLLGEEGGLLPAPVSLTQVTLGPAERADLVLDFASHAAGADLYLVNSAPAPFPGTPGVGVLPQVMKFEVVGTPGFIGALPGSLRSMEVLDEMDAVQHREFELLNAGANQCSSFMWEIVSLDENGDPTGSMWTDIVEFPELGSTEVWSFINRSGMMHPMHMHLVFFQVLDRTPIDSNGDPTGPAVAPPPEEAGWKDTVQVDPLEIVRVIARFEDYTGLFPYHCHILEHEDQEMMRQFQTISCGNGDLEPTEECDDGNATLGDGCSDTCEIEDAVSFYGQAQGGDVTITVNGVLLVVPTTPGQLGGAVAAAVAAAIEADPTLSAEGVTAFADGQHLVTTGTIDSVVVNDPGLSTSASALVPALSGLGLLVLVGALVVTARQRRLAR